MIGYVTPSYLHYYQELMAGLRRAIEAGKLGDFAAGFAETRGGGDLPPFEAGAATDEERERTP